MSELPTVEKSPEQKMLEEYGAVISCDRFSSKTRDNGKPKWQPILIGTSIVCDGWESGNPVDTTTGTATRGGNDVVNYNQINIYFHLPSVNGRRCPLSLESPESTAPDTA